MQTIDQEIREALANAIYELMDADQRDEALGKVIESVDVVMHALTESALDGEIDQQTLSHLKAQAANLKATLGIELGSLVQSTIEKILSRGLGVLRKALA